MIPWDACNGAPAEKTPKRQTIAIAEKAMAEAPSAAPSEGTGFPCGLTGIALGCSWSTAAWERGRRAGSLVRSLRLDHGGLPLDPVHGVARIDNERRPVGQFLQIDSAVMRGNDHGIVRSD